MTETSEDNEYGTFPFNLHLYFFKESFLETGLKVTVELGSDVVSVMLVTFLPTLLMNIINQATVFASKENNKEFIITINVTCMMVLTSG